MDARPTCPLQTWLSENAEIGGVALEDLRGMLRVVEEEESPLTLIA
jgi:hypothetical protein